LVLQIGANIDQSTGVVESVVSYYKTSQRDVNDGILLVITHATRQR
jgi:hypothetical protein